MNKTGTVLCTWSKTLYDSDDHILEWNSPPFKSAKDFAFNIHYFTVFPNHRGY